MSVPAGFKAINWKRSISDGTETCAKCGKHLQPGEIVDTRLDGYVGDPTTFCAPCVTPTYQAAIDGGARFK